MATFHVSENGAGLGNGSNVANAVAFNDLYLDAYGNGSAGEFAGGHTVLLMRNSDGSEWEVDPSTECELFDYNTGTSSAPLIISGCNHLGVIDGVRTKIKYTASADYMFKLGLGANYVRFQHLEVDCNDLCDIIINAQGGATAGEYPTAYNIHGINGARCVSFRGKGAKIHNCYAKDMSAYGFVLTGNGSQIISNCVAIDATDSSGNSNFYLADTAYMVNCYSEGGAGYGVKVAGDNASILSCTINDAGVNGILSEHHGFTAINNIISNNTLYGLDDNGADDLNISDYNLYYNNTGGNRYDMGKGFHDIDNLNPLFTDTANYDASVGSNSPAWRAGTNGDTIGYTRRPHGVIMGGYEHLS
jgi:hypothetical protein